MFENLLVHRLGNSFNLKVRFKEFFGIRFHRGVFSIGKNRYVEFIF